MKINKVILHLGYVESNTSAVLIHQSETFFPSKKKALESFAEYIWMLYQEAYEISVVKECCAATLKKKDNARFCSICGRSTLESKPSSVQFIEYIGQLFYSDANDYPQPSYTEVDPDGWSPWNNDWKSMDKQVLIKEQGAQIIAIALLRKRPALVEHLGDEFVFADDSTDWVFRDYLEAIGK